MRGNNFVTLLTTTLIVAAFGVLLTATGCNNQPASQADKAEPAAATPKAQTPEPPPASQPSEVKPATEPKAEPVAQTPASASNPAVPEVVIETSLGKIVLQLDAERTPITTANFLKYVDDKFFDGIIFHRVINGFMIQAGGHAADLSKKQATYPPIVNESQNSATNDRGTISMARTGDPNSASSQFFINLKDNTGLNFGGPYGGYCVFGRVIEGMDVVDKIANVPVRRTQLSEAQPLENVVINTIRRR